MCGCGGGLLLGVELGSRLRCGLRRRANGVLWRQCYVVEGCGRQQEACLHAMMSCRTEVGPPWPLRLQIWSDRHHPTSTRNQHAEVHNATQKWFSLQTGMALLHAGFSCQQEMTQCKSCAACNAIVPETPKSLFFLKCPRGRTANANFQTYHQYATPA